MRSEASRIDPIHSRSRSVDAVIGSLIVDLEWIGNVGLAANFEAQLERPRLAELRHQE
jgi:hypothetical protein